MALQSKGRHMWPLQVTSHPAAAQLPIELFMRRERRRLQVHHIWMEIKPKWSKWLTLYRRLFFNEFTEESRWLEDPYKVPDKDHITRQWTYHQAWFTEQWPCLSPFRWASAPYVHQLDHALAWQWGDTNALLFRYGTPNRVSFDASCFQMKGMIP